MAGVDILASAFSGANAAFLGEQYARWAADPASVDPTFAELFGALNDDARSVLEEATGASWAPRHPEFEDEVRPVVTQPPRGAPRISARQAPTPLSGEQIRAATIASLRALMLIRSYRVRGHLEARLDPLGLQIPKPHAELDPRSYGFTDNDLDKPIFIDNVLGRETATLREILTILRETYCGPIGVEFMHIQDPDQKSWIQRRVEGAPWRTAFDADGEAHHPARSSPRRKASRRSARSATSPPSASAWKAARSPSPRCTRSSRRWPRPGVVEIAIGMPHRGRLNTLVNIVKKPFTAVFSEFGGESFKPDDVQGSGDVKYHLGTSTDIEIAGRSVHLSLQPNPSHLEAVDPVVVGKVRARQDRPATRSGGRSVMAILMHGDAAFAGQGLVYETLAMSQLIGYRTGGTIHLVVNNQIGFTTVPAHAYSGLYCTDVAKSIQAPILHVNGDDPEAVIFCARMAAEFRMRFATDIVLDIVCYRRHGHNETDEPAFTQPLMYRAINQTKTTRTLYAERLAAEGVLSAAEAQAMWDEFQRARWRTPMQAAQGLQAEQGRLAGRPLAGFTAAGRRRSSARGRRPRSAPTTLQRDRHGAVARAGRLRRASAASPASSRPSRRCWRPARASTGRPARRWRSARCCWKAIASACRARTCQRGTFSQRHAVLIDQTNQNEYVPLNNIAPDQAKIEIYNSLLSEAGVLGFEYGYSLADPRTLVLWEAQFGDFANGAQVIIDQFLAERRDQVAAHVGPDAAAAARLRRPGAGALLGAHRALSAALRRAQHVRVQPDHAGQLLPRAAPAVEAQLPQAAGDLHAEVAAAAQAGGVVARRDEPRAARSSFVIPEIDAIAPPEQVRRVVLCSRQGLLRPADRAARAQGSSDVAIMRLEQLYPFPENTLAPVLAPYRNAEVVWCQEEPENMGAWNFVDRRLEKVLSRLDGKATRPHLCRTRGGGEPGHRLGARACARSRRRWSPRALGNRADMATEIKVPTLGESVTSATVARWMKHEGEAVAADEPLVELETDKVTVEVSAPSAGVLTSISAPGGQRGPGRRAARPCWRPARSRRRARPSAAPSQRRRRAACRRQCRRPACIRRRARSVRWRVRPRRRPMSPRTRRCRPPPS